MRGDTNEFHAGEEAPGPRGEYIEQDDRILLTNPFLQLVLAKTNGTILSLRQRQTQVELIDLAEARDEGFLWQIEIRSEDGQTHIVTSRDCPEFSYSFGRHRHDDPLRLWLQWRGFLKGAEPAASALTAQISLPNDSPSVRFDHEVELPAGHSVGRLEFPCLCSVGSTDPLSDDGVFLPLSGGIYLPTPRSQLPASQPHVWSVEYPGPASLQLFGYCGGDRTTLWLAARDAEGAAKSLALSLMPSSGRLRFWIGQQPSLRPDGHWSSAYSAAVGLVTGDWFEAATEYRSWAARQPWSSRGRGGERRMPALTSAYGLWASYWGGARRCPAAARELQRLVNVPIKVDWRCWHACARDGAYPDYLPPRDGEETHSAAERQLTDLGVLDQLNASALLASRESTAWREEDAAAYALRGRGDKPSGTRATERTAALEVMCPGTMYWRDKIATVGSAVAERGADGLLLEGLGRVGAVCEELDHEHAPPCPTQWTTDVRSLISAVRASIGPHRQIATDALGEHYLDLIDAFFTNHAAAEREDLVPGEFGHRWVPIPLFAAVYHDYTATVGSGVSLVNQRPHDPLWPAPVVGEMREPAHLMGRDYQMQFCLEVARSIVWGYQPLLEGFAVEHARSDANRHKLAFLAAALRAQAWGIGALLPQARFMGVLDIECPVLEVDLLVDPPNGAASDRRVIRRAVPSVLGSAWRVPGGGLALTLANVHTRSVDFTARLRSSRLSLQLPLRLIGRTFSEDGDVPAASLRAAGSEIGGHLPHRAIVLVSVR